MANKTRVRFAPSPTGPLHIGGVRTALYNYLFAKQQKGDFILRIEDTDSQRFVPGSEEYIQESFNWLGMEFDESPTKGGKFGPYRQSERKELYKKYVHHLLEQGKAYIAFDTPQELDAKRKEIANFQYDASTRDQMRNSLTLDDEEIKTLLDRQTQYVVRIKLEPGIDIKVNDLIRGEVTINSSVLDDKVIFKSSDELPTYHLANVVDDHLMRITHVIRGEEWLPSAPLHVWLYRVLGWEDTMPAFAHLPLLLKPEGNGKLSKRDGDRLGFPVFPLEWKDPQSGDISSGYRENGYLPEAVINFLSLLGWNPGTDQEVFDIEGLIEAFSFDRCSKSGAKFDFEKGKWFNHKYIQETPDEQIAKMVQPQLEAHGVKFDAAYTAQVSALVKERVYLISDFWEQSSFFFKAPESYDAKVVRRRWKEETPEQMRELIGVLAQLDDFSSETQEVAVKQWIKDKGYNMGGIMNAFRLSIVGESKGPHMFDITALLGRKETEARLQRAISKLSE